MVKVKVFDTPENSERDAVDAPSTDSKAFKEIVTSRRSVRFFSKDPIPQSVIDDCIDSALLAPNSSNLQCWEIHHVADPAKKRELAKHCLSQPAAKTAKELFVFVTRPDLWKRNNQLTLDEFDRRGDMPESAYQYFRVITKLAYSRGPFGLKAPIKWLFFNLRGFFQPTPRGPLGKWGMKVWGHKSTALACAHFMLAMRSHGFDTCPMEGFDVQRVKKLLALPSGADVTMVISAGKRAEGGIYGARFRFDKSLTVKQH